MVLQIGYLSNISATFSTHLLLLLLYFHCLEFRQPFSVKERKYLIWVDRRRQAAGRKYLLDWLLVVHKIDMRRYPLYHISSWVHCFRWWGFRKRGESVSHGGFYFDLFLDSFQSSASAPSSPKAMIAIPFLPRSDHWALSFCIEGGLRHDCKEDTTESLG